MSGHLVVVEPGPLTTVQDRGRAGLAHLGVPRSGALDAAAASLANRLVGNDAGAALLETTAGGVRFVLETAGAVAVTGARCSVEVSGRAAPFGEFVAVRAGEEVVVGHAIRGVRSYVAVAGGLEPPAVLGSRSTDTLSGLGPPPLAGGAMLPVGAAARQPPGLDLPADDLRTGTFVGRAGGPAVLRCLTGPRADWLRPDALRTLTEATYRVAAESNRVGLRLTGPAVARGRADELPSEGVVLGAVQVPASGQPVVFLNDHPTTGGYPVVAVVDRGDLDRCAQLRPGDAVRLTLREAPALRALSSGWGPAREPGQGAGAASG